MELRAAFWFSVFVIVYIYLGYPLLLSLWARAARRSTGNAEWKSSGKWPSISVVIAARNEAAHLPARVKNLLQLSYPGEREIIVVSDGSTDGTAEVLEPLKAHLRFVEVPAGGKPLALNAAVQMATGEIVVFADARQHFGDAALVELVANFADPQVGGVTGELILDCEEPDGAASTIGDGMSLYWTYEKWLRRNESAVWSTLGATGAIYAMRRSLWQPLPADTLLDDVLAPMRLVLAGHRVVFEERARAYDRTSADAPTEARRKVRTLAGNYQILSQEPKLLIPLVNPVWLQYMSHKVGRLLVPWALVCAFVTSVALAPTHWFFTLVLFAQTAFYLLAGFGAALDVRDRKAVDGFSKALPAMLDK
jgi:biofilm PGA synthesis N-glycosyltransferase PgaC